MGFPTGVQTVVLTGRVAGADGAADRDTITITQSPERVVSSTYEFISDRKDVTVIPDRATGSWAVRLLAVDAATFNPSGWTYQVQIGASTPFSIDLPAGTSPVDLSTLIPVTADPGVYTLLVPVAEAEAYADEGDAATLSAAEAYADQHGGGSSPWVFDVTAHGAFGDARTAPDGAIGRDRRRRGAAQVRGQGGARAAHPARGRRRRHLGAQLTDMREDRPASIGAVLFVIFPGLPAAVAPAPKAQCRCPASRARISTAPSAASATSAVRSAAGWRTERCMRSPSGMCPPWTRRRCTSRSCRISTRVRTVGLVVAQAPQR